MLELLVRRHLIEKTSEDNQRERAFLKPELVFHEVGKQIYGRSYASMGQVNTSFRYVLCISYWQYASMTAWSERNVFLKNVQHFPYAWKICDQSSNFTPSPPALLLSQSLSPSLCRSEWTQIITWCWECPETPIIMSLLELEIFTALWPTKWSMLGLKTLLPYLGSQDTHLLCLQDSLQKNNVFHSWKFHFSVVLLQCWIDPSSEQ